MNFHTNNTFNTLHCRWLIIFLFTCIPCVSNAKTPIYMPNKLFGCSRSNLSIIKTVIMQNEPKFSTARMDIKPVLLSSYKANSVSVACQNEPKTKPNKPDLSQFYNRPVENKTVPKPNKLFGYFRRNPAVVTSVIMQNKANFLTTRMSVSDVLLSSYEANSVSVACQNKPNPKPIKTQPLLLQEH